MFSIRTDISCTDISGSDTSLEVPTVSEVELYRPKSIDEFLNPDPADPDEDEWSALHSLHQRKHIVRFSTREARKSTMYIR